MRRPLILTSLLLLGLGSTACASRPPTAPASEAGPPPPPAPPPEEPLAEPAKDDDADAGGDARDGQDDVGDAEEPSPKSGAKRTTSVGPSTARRFRSVPDALSSLEEEEIKLSRLLNLDAQALSSAGGCLQVCGSLASMRRAADALCDLAGNGDARCEDARSRVRRSEERVSASGCACDGG